MSNIPGPAPHWGVNVNPAAIPVQTVHPSAQPVQQQQPPTGGLTYQQLPFNEPVPQNMVQAPQFPAAAPPAQPQFQPPPAQTQFQPPPMHTQFGQPQQAAPFIPTGQVPFSVPQQAMPTTPAQSTFPAQVQAPVQSIAQPAAPTHAPAPSVASVPAAAPALAPAPATAEPPTIQSMLKAFAKQKGCERYTADAEKVKLMALYLFLRQLTPALSFELFLQLYEPFADSDEKNCKEPFTAINQLLPRTKKKADEANTHHWSSKEVVDYVALYIDMIRYAETVSSPLGMTLNEFLQNPGLLEQFHAGAFKEVPQAKTSVATAPVVTDGQTEPATKKSKAKPKTAQAASTARVTPTAAGQRVILTLPGTGRQYRGYLTAYWVDPPSGNAYADFQDDSGEVFRGLGIHAYEMCNDPPPNVPQTTAGEALPELGNGVLSISPAEMKAIREALSYTTAIGTVKLGDPIYQYQHLFSQVIAAQINVVNCETGPTVDAFLFDTRVQDAVLAEVNPARKNMEGTYIFETKDGFYRLEIRG